MHLKTGTKRVRNLRIRLFIINATFHKLYIFSLFETQLPCIDILNAYDINLLRVESLHCQTQGFDFF